MWRPKSKVGNHPQALFHLSQWGRIFHQPQNSRICSGDLSQARVQAWVLTLGLTTESSPQPSTSWVLRQHLSSDPEFAVSASRDSYWALWSAFSLCCPRYPGFCFLAVPESGTIRFCLLLAGAEDRIDVLWFKNKRNPGSHVLLINFSYSKAASASTDKRRPAVVSLMLSRCLQTPLVSWSSSIAREGARLSSHRWQGDRQSQRGIQRGMSS